MSQTIFSNFKITITPNSIPSWSGEMPMRVFDKDIKIVNITVPLYKDENGDEVMTSLDLYITNYSENNLETISLNGILGNTRILSKLVNPNIVTPCPDSILYDEETAEQYEDFDIIAAELLGDAVVSLFEDTGWTVKYSAIGVVDLPVVTEVNPVMALNGSIIEQFGQLIDLFNASSGVWDQKLTYFINPFENEILVVPPTNGDSNINILNADNARIHDISIEVQNLDLPAKIILQESETALFRDIKYLENYRTKSEDYSYTTYETINEEDTDVTNISATISGTSLKVGELVLTETQIVDISQTTTSYVDMGIGRPYSATDFSLTLIKNTISHIETITEYEYLTGPPYDNNALYYIDNPINGCFTKSLVGTRQQISRDLGSVKINKDHHPEYIFSTDGIRVIKKNLTTIEYTTTSLSIINSVLNPGVPKILIPGMSIDLATTTTTIEERYAYDEDGNLVLERSKKTVEARTSKEETESVRKISPVTEELSTEFTYTLQNTYYYDGSLGNTTVTDVNTQLIASGQNGPSLASALDSTENIDVPEETYKEYTEQISKYLRNDNVVIDITEIPEGNEYIVLENLTLDEVKEYFDTYYNFNPKEKWQVSFVSDFLDVRGILGGHIQLQSSGSPNIPTLFDNNIDQVQLYESGLMEAMNTPFVVSGITMNWEGQENLNVAIACYQTI